MAKIFIVAFSLMILSGCIHHESSQPKDYREQIRLTVRANKQKLQSCYDDALKRDQTTLGKIVLAWKIMPDGAVADMKIDKSTTGDSKFDNCLADVMKTVKFAKPSSGEETDITFPFVFSTGGSSDVPATRAEPPPATILPALPKDDY